MSARRDEVASFPLYTQGALPTGDDVVKLSSNENPYPPLPSVVRVISEAAATINRYPDMGAVALRTALADRLRVDVSRIAVGTGSVEVAQQVIQAVAGPGDEVMFAWRSFEAYPIMTRIAGATPVPVPLTVDERHDFAAMKAAITPATKVIFVCSPNNPTGTTATTEEVEDLLASVPTDVVVVIDEAYIQFNRRADTVSGVDLAARYPNVVALHTFSKAYGLAGLRVGYAVAPPDLADDMRRVSLPFGVTDLAQKAAIASLRVDHELLERVDSVVAERARVREGLIALGWTIPDTQANLVWVRTGDDTARINAALRDAHVLVRAWDGEGLRITIGAPSENDRLLKAFASLS